MTGRRAATAGDENPRSTVTAAKDAHADSQAPGSLIDWSAARHVKAQAEDVQIGQLKRVQTDFLSEMSRVTSPLVEAVNKLTTTPTAAADEDGDDGYGQDDHGVVEYQVVLVDSKGEPIVERM